MNFIFVSPHFPNTYWNFCDRLHRNGVNVLGIGDAPFDEIPGELKHCLTEYYRVDNLGSYEEMLRAVAYFTFHYGKIDWIESNNEYWLEMDAQLRTDFNINTGAKNDFIERIKYKSRMKESYRAAGVPVARHHMVSTLAAASVDTEILVAIQVQTAHLIIAYHVCPDLVAVHRVGIVDHIGGVTACRTHIDLKCHIIALFAKARLILVQLEKLTVEKPAFSAKSLDRAEAHILERRRNRFLRPVAQIAVLTDDVQQRGGEHIGGVEQRHTMAVGHAVKADDLQYWYC